MNDKNVGLTIMTTILHRSTPLIEQDFNMSMMELIDDIKECIPDSKYLQICNKLKENNELKFRYIQLKIHKDFKKLIKKEYNEIYPLIHKITLEVSKFDKEIHNAIINYIEHYLFQMKDNIINLAFKKIIKNSGEVIKDLKKQNPDVEEKKLKIFMLLKSNCKCCSLVSFKQVRVCQFIEKKEF